jgi:adenine-specific DNA-methyltransferase
LRGRSTATELPEDASLLTALAPEQRRRLGCYFTPMPLAELMAEWVLEARSDGGEGVRDAYIDPAAGSGRLLQAVGQRLREPPGARGSVGTELAERLVGIERVPELARYTNRRLRDSLGLSRDVCHVDDALALFRASVRRQRLGRASFEGVVANPPYVREKSHKALFRAVLEREPAWAEHFRPRQDLQRLFLILGLELLAPAGHLVYLVNPYWLHSDGAQALRERVRRRARVACMVDFGELRIFPDAVGQHNLLIHLVDHRGSGPDTAEPTLYVRVRGMPEGGLRRLCELLRRLRRGEPVARRHLEARWEREPPPRGRRGRWHWPSKNDALLAQMEDTEVVLGDLFETHQGVVSGADKVTRRHLSHLADDVSLGQGIFVLRRDEVDALDLNAFERALVRPLYRARHIRALAIEPAERAILYLYRGVEASRCPNLLAHLARFRPILERRRECRQGTIPWYELHWPRAPSLFDRPRLVTPRRSQAPRFAMGLAGHCEQSDIALITCPSDDARRLTGLAVLLNSAPVALWCRHRGKHKGRVRELFGRALEEIPLPAGVRESPTVWYELAALAGDPRVDEVVASLYGLPAPTTRP